MENTKFFDIYEIFNEGITSHNKNINIDLVKYVIKLIFDKAYTPPNKSELQNKLTIFHLEKVLVLWIQLFSELGYKSFHISKMCSTIESNKRYLAYDF